MKQLFLALTGLILLSSPSIGQNQKTKNVFIITLDGLRWQELFGGADDSLIVDTRFVKDTTQLKEKYFRSDKREARRTLMPWMWSTVQKEGTILGNRSYGNKVDVTNMMWFSYPGYNEILVGYSDPNINTNDKKPNPNITVLEWLNNKNEFHGKVAAFGSWDVFPYIINQERSKIPVNAGFETANGTDLSAREIFLNELQSQIPSPWQGVRLDGFTHHYTLEYLKKNKPRVVYISYGETDDFAHDGRYDHYLNAANNTDGFLKNLWDYCQSDEFYKGVTSFIITTDHGRGDVPKKEWTSHGKIIKGSNSIWIALLGPGIPGLGEVTERGQYWQNQVASTVALLLGYEYKNVEEVGKPLSIILKK